MALSRTKARDVLNVPICSDDRVFSDTNNNGACDNREASFPN